MSEFFTADTHFMHDRIRGYCGRPFTDVNHMDEALIENWNAIVETNDTVYHVGDVAFGPEAKDTTKVKKLLNRLNGDIHLILGNHDEAAVKCSSRFASIKHCDEVGINGQRIVLFHYGLRTWHHDLRGVWHLYGHSHGSLKPYGKSTDIGVDCWDYKPVSFEQLKSYMDKREIGDHPKFENFVVQKEGTK